METPAQYARPRALGRALGRGFLFAPPADAGAVEELLWGDAPLPAWDDAAAADARGGRARRPTADGLR